MVEYLSDENIKAFLETAPLYSWREFGKPATDRSSLWIGEIDDFCEICDQQRPFHDRRGRGGGAGMPTPTLHTGTSYFEFTCVSCRKAHRELLVEQVVDDETIRIQKYGERPRKPLVRDRVLQRFLKDDLDYYEKAVVCLTHEYGVGAFAYFRRIVENNINMLLDLVEEDARSSSVDSETLDAITELRNERRPMADKIKIANRALPDYLKPDGLNPLGSLYGVLSSGIHSLSEADCLQKSKATRQCLVFLVGELASRRKNRRLYKNMVNQL